METTTSSEPEQITGPGEFQKFLPGLEFVRPRREPMTVTFEKDGGVYIEFDNGDHGWGATPSQAVWFSAAEFDQIVATREALR